MVAQTQQPPAAAAPPQKLTAARVLMARAPWDALDDAYAARIPFDSPAEHRDLFRRECNAGRAACYHLHDAAGARCGIIICRVEEAAERELVLMGIYAETADGVPLTGQISGLCDDLARAERCTSIRFHTIRPAVARAAVAFHGFRLTELVMRRAVTLTD